MRDKMRIYSIGAVAIACIMFLSLLSISSAQLAVTLTPTSAVIDSNQAIVFTASWSGGTGATNTVTLYSIPSSTEGSTCSSTSGASQVSQQAGVTTNTYTLSGISGLTAGTTDYYCANVIDANSASGDSGVSIVTVNQVPTITITASSNSISIGQSITYTANIVGGTGPFTVNLISNGVTENSISFAIGGNTLSYTPIQTGSLTFNAIATDTGTTPFYTFNSLSNTIIVTSNTPTVTAPSPSNVTLVPGQGETFNAIITGGTGPFTVNLVNTTTGTTVQELTGQADGIVTFTGFPIINTGAHTYNIVATDTGTSYTFNSVTTSVTVNTNSILGNVIVVPGTYTVVNDINIGFVFALSANSQGGSTNVFVGNVLGLSPAAPANYLTLSAVNVIVDPLVVSNIIVTASYPCGIPSRSIQPFELSSTGTWVAISPFRVNAAACTLTFTVDADPVIAIMQNISQSTPHNNNKVLPI